MYLWLLKNLFSFIKKTLSIVEESSGSPDTTLQGLKSTVVINSIYGDRPNLDKPEFCVH